ncbi:MAG TPA: BTAD domain-containing putative transcriptional regulator, partial [Polyangiaceae bacterium]
MRGLDVRLLGELQVVRDGRTTPLPASKKTRALLVYLVATGRPHSRERLCELFWPGPDDPRAALRWSLTKIRALLDDGAHARVAADRERVAFEAHGATSDVEALRTLVNAGVADADTRTLRAASELFRGELGEGLDLADAYRYEEWLAGEREAARATRLRILGMIVDRLRGEPEAALPYARQRVAIDPLSEAAHVTVIELLAQLGNKREALAQFEACARILETELHAKPGPAMLAARMGIGRRGDSTPAAAPPPLSPAPLPPPSSRAHPPASSPPRLPLFGRARERDAIRRHVDAVQARGGAEASAPRLLLFAGEPGIGKSRLLDELGRAAAASGARVLRGRAYEAEMVRPYGAWIDALRSAELAALAGS